MAEAAAFVEGLKRHLKARKITYAEVAKSLRVSEASVKRMFSKGSFTLDRFEQICQFAGTSITQLARETDSGKVHVSQLTLEQEKEIIRDRKLLLIALCALNQLTLEQIVDTYSVSKTECIQLLVKLDRIKFLELLPNNQVKLLVARTFSWLPEGPIQQYFKARAQNEYFRSQFGGPDEILLLVSGMLSPASTQLMLSRLKRVANEFSEMHNADAGLALSGRRPASLVVAMRPWELDEFRELRRRKPAERAARRGHTP
jgi:transcriptional regulator with XRE-family HTH domain